MSRLILRPYFGSAVHTNATIASHAHSLFLRRDVNKAFARVTGGKVNRGVGYGLEIQCVYQFYGPKPYIDKLREVIDSLKTSGLV